VLNPLESTVPLTRDGKYVDIPKVKEITIFDLSLILQLKILAFFVPSILLRQDSKTQIEQVLE